MLCILDNKPWHFVSKKKKEKKKSNNVIECVRSNKCVRQYQKRKLEIKYFATFLTVRRCGKILFLFPCINSFKNNRHEKKFPISFQEENKNCNGDKIRTTLLSNMVEFQFLLYELSVQKFTVCYCHNLTFFYLTFLKTIQGENKK